MDSTVHAVTVRFPTASSRDMLNQICRNLTPETELQKQVPDFLQEHFSVMNQFAYKLRSESCGTTKTSIRYCDEEYGYSLWVRNKDEQRYRRLSVPTST